MLLVVISNMKNLNTYINEAWSGVKQHALKSDIEVWCEEMGIKNYTINPKGEIDVDGYVYLQNKNFKELPYKFGTITGYFDIGHSKNLISLKNCPNIVMGSFGCECCLKLDSLKGCPKEVGGHFWCGGCKQKFTREEVESLCKIIKGEIYTK